MVLLLNISKNHSDLCLAGEDKDFINRFMTHDGQTIFKPALAKDIFKKRFRIKYLWSKRF